MNELRILFRSIKRKYPDTYEELLNQYVEKIIELRNQKNKVFIVAVLNEFREDKELEKIALCVYENYQNTNFIARNLSEKNIDEILQAFVDSVNQIYEEEVSHV